MLESTIASRKLALGVRYHKLVVLIKTMELTQDSAKASNPLHNPTLLEVVD